MVVCLDARLEQRYAADATIRPTVGVAGTPAAIWCHRREAGIRGPSSATSEVGLAIHDDILPAQSGANPATCVIFVTRLWLEGCAQSVDGCVDQGFAPAADWAMNWVLRVGGRGAWSGAGLP